MDNRSFKFLVTVVAASMLVIGTLKITRNKSRIKSTTIPAVAKSKK